jgi:hypothetical protein
VLQHGKLDLKMSSQPKFEFKKDDTDVLSRLKERRSSHRPQQPIFKINNTPADPKTVGALRPEL